jgi:PAS domain S-box-containing protein
VSRHNVVRILHLEDDAGDAELIAAILRAEAQNWEVVVADSPEAFVRSLDSNGFDVILADYTIPGFDGLAALSLARDKSPDVPFILVSGTVGEERAIDALSRGVTDFVLKDRLGRLVPAVRRALEEARAHRAQRAVENALHESERRFRSLVENALEGIFQEAPDGRFTAANPAFARILGYESTQHLISEVGNASQLYVDPRRRAELLVTLEIEGQVSGFEVQLRRKDGRLIWTRQAIRALRDSQGHPLSFEGLLEDVTERRGAEEALLESERWLRETQQIAQVGSWAWDVRNNEVVWSDELYRIHGIPQHERPSTHKGHLERVIPDDRARVAEIITEALRNLEPVEYEFRIVRGDGSLRTLRTYGRVQTDASGQAARMVGATQDITASRLLEEQLRQAQKMEAIGQLAGGIAHDFNNLLGVISGYGDLLMKEIGPQHPGHRRLEQIRRAADRAAGLTRQLLAFSRKQTLQPAVLDLNTVVGDIDNMLRRLIGEHIQFVSALAPKLGKVRADPGQVEQVLVNLAVNARDAMPGGGKLIIETADAFLDRTYLQTHADVRPGPYVVLAVSDTGHGMDAETVSHIFEPFFTTKDPGKGTGLGLSTVYGIVKQSEGLVHVYSEPGRGTTFKVYLPRVDEDGAVERPKVATEAEPGGSETVLLAEDENSLRILIREVLKDAGYRVIEATNAEEAVSRAESHSGPLHLLISDVIMPRMTGRQLAAHVTAKRPGCKVLYMSGYTPEALGHQGLSDPGTHFIEKPFTMNALLRKVRDVLGSDGA